ncbi:DJ-1/PfpI family protein [Hyphobacterium marinum]|uniref:DJ-1/PfpI family protein n=1 Tax=Hyphobacterium marinum TaxID=3116574 RepID=A0ABU7LUU2_9PROT|nr:DJ-1/PfpI family protein [Hyphobacterium sp. Y6023]MEE2565332.1 DJ-1/PfpI family protein [Hyphobacterium sp. Y6023]
MNRYSRKKAPRRGHIAAIAPQGFNADDLMLATGPLDRAGFDVAVVSDTDGMLSARAGETDVNYVPASTIGDMDFDRYAGLILPGGSSKIADSAKAAVAVFLKAGKPVIALSDGVGLLAEAANAPDTAEATAAISARGQVFAAGGETAAEDAVQVFADAVLSAVTETRAA